MSSDRTLHMQRLICDSYEEKLSEQAQEKESELSEQAQALRGEKERELSEQARTLRKEKWRLVSERNKEHKSLLQEKMESSLVEKQGLHDRIILGDKARVDLQNRLGLANQARVDLQTRLGLANQTIAGLSNRLAQYEPVVNQWGWR